MKNKLGLETIRIPEGNYVSKFVAAEWLGIDPTTLQTHIKKGHIKTIPFPRLGHMIERDDLYEFALNRRSQGKPTIHQKYDYDRNVAFSYYCERCDKLGFGECHCQDY